MKITKEFLKEKGACRSGYGWFIENFPDGEAEYQDVLDRLAEDDQISHASWLMQKAGSDNSVKEVDELSGVKNFFFAGKVVVKGMISVTGYLMAGSGIEAGDGIEAGFGIKAGDGIKAGWGIKAGEGIEAGCGIKAGEDYGIFAGLHVEIGRWEFYAKVTAKTKPENLISGFWCESSESEEAA